MREFLFRGKRKADGKWIEGLINKHFSAIFGEEYFIISYENEYNVIPETVGQYTGLHDMNGARIFEGDILKLKDYHGERTVYIFWGDVAWFYGGDGYSDEYFFNSHERKIIGNIHDNPELIWGDDENERNGLQKQMGDRTA